MARCVRGEPFPQLNPTSWMYRLKYLFKNTKSHWARRPRSREPKGRACFREQYNALPMFPGIERDDSILSLRARLEKARIDSLPIRR